MALIWIFLGALMVGLAWGVYTWIKNRDLHANWLSWIGIVFSFLLLFFTLAWFLSSLVEGEPRAAGMGLLIFGVFTLIVMLLTRKNILKESGGPSETE